MINFCLLVGKYEFFKFSGTGHVLNICKIKIIKPKRCYANTKENMLMFLEGMRNGILLLILVGQLNLEKLMLRKDKLT